MTRTRSDLSVIIAGCGSIGRRHARCLRALGIRNLSACDPVKAQAETLQRESPMPLFASFEEALASKPDTVFICSPPELHIPMALQAISAGAHVFCEKPLSNSDARIDELAQAAQSAGRSVMTGLCFRFHAGLRKAKSILDSGQLGRLVCIRSLMGENLPSVRPDYQNLFSSSHGGAFDLSHEVDLAVWFADRPVKNIQAMAGSFSDIGIQAADLAQILIEFETKTLAAIHLDFFQIPRRRQTELICTAGVIIVEFGQWDRCTIAVSGADGIWSKEEIATKRDDMFQAEECAFLDAVAAARPVECGIDQARQSVKIIERAQACAGIPPQNR